MSLLFTMIGSAKGMKTAETAKLVQVLVVLIDFKRICKAFSQGWYYVSQTEGKEATNVHYTVSFSTV